MSSFNTEKESAESVVFIEKPKAADIQKKKKVKNIFLKKEIRQIYLDLHFTHTDLYICFLLFFIIEVIIVIIYIASVATMTTFNFTLLLFFDVFAIFFEIA